MFSLCLHKCEYQCEQFYVINNAHLLTNKILRSQLCYGINNADVYLFFMFTSCPIPWGDVSVQQHNDSNFIHTWPQVTVISVKTITLELNYKYTNKNAYYYYYKYQKPDCILF